MTKKSDQFYWSLLGACRERSDRILLLRNGKWNQMSVRCIEQVKGSTFKWRFLNCCSDEGTVKWSKAIFQTGAQNTNPFFPYAFEIEMTHEDREDLVKKLIDGDLGPVLMFGCVRLGFTSNSNAIAAVALYESYQKPRRG